MEKIVKNGKFEKNGKMEKMEKMKSCFLEVNAFFKKKFTFFQFLYIGGKPFYAYI